MSVFELLTKYFKGSTFKIEAKDIFYEDSEGNTLYQVFSIGKHHIINDKAVQDKLVSLEDYRHFILSFRAPVWIPLSILAFIIVFTVNFFFKLDYGFPLGGAVILLSTVLYVATVIGYYIKIYSAIKSVGR